MGSCQNSDKSQKPLPAASAAKTNPKNQPPTPPPPAAVAAPPLVKANADMKPIPYNKEALLKDIPDLPVKEVDWQNVFEQLGDDNEFFGTLWYEMEKNLRETTPKVLAAYEQKAFVDLFKCAHSLQGSLRTLGAVRWGLQWRHAETTSRSYGERGTPVSDAEYKKLGQLIYLSIDGFDDVKKCIQTEQPGIYKQWQLKASGK